MRIVGPLLQHFDLLTIIDKDIFYKKTKKYNLHDGETQKLYGGLRIVDFEQILANVLPGKKYYYTVIAVNERRQFLPYAPIVYGIASDNLPTKSDRFYAVWLSDIQQLNFEFELPLFVDDVAQHSIYMLHKSETQSLVDFQNYMLALDSWNRAYTEGDTLAIMPDAFDMPGVLIDIAPSSFPFPSLNFTSLFYADGFLSNKTGEFVTEFSPENITDYVFYLSLDDYAGFSATSEPIVATISESKNLPILPSLEIRNKANSKGDALEILIGKPLALITTFNFRSHTADRRKLTVAYTYNENPNYKVRSIRFDFFANDGTPLVSHTEHFIDNIFNLNLPDDRYFDEGFRVEISFNAPNTDIHNKPYLTQDIYYDPELMMLTAGHLRADGEDLLNYRYLVIKQSLSDRLPRIENRLTPLLNRVDDNIAFEKYIFKGIADFCLKNNHLLFDTTVDLGWDEELETYLMTSIFFSDYLESLQSQIEHLTILVAGDPDDAESAYFLEYYQSVLEMQSTHPLLSEINQISNPRQRLRKLIDIRERNRRTFSYFLVKTDGQGHFVVSDIYTDAEGNQYFFPKPAWFNTNYIPMLIATLVFGFFVFYFYIKTRSGKHMFIRPIAGLEEVDNAIGRATEMGRPILFVPGLTSIDDVATLAGLSILGHITRKAAEYDTRIIVPCSDYIVLPIAQQIVKEAHSAAGRPDSFNPNDIFFVAEEQFAFVAGVNGIMLRQKTATNFYMGMFFAEALIMTETGNHTGAIQIAGTDALTQIPFFITTCDYTLLGEELYAASAYLTRDPVIVGTLKSQDYTKLIIIICIVVGTILSTLNVTGFINWLPTE
jgi:hypothetical protein